MKTDDSKIKSLVEAIFNIVVGFTINLVANILILPAVFNIPFTIKKFAWIGLLYTLISLARSYLLRRLFVNGFYEWWVKKQ